MDEHSGRARTPCAPQNVLLSDSIATLCVAHAPVDPAARFTLLWCVKESYVKAKGEGLSSAFDSLELSLINTIRINTDRKARFWTWEGAEYQTALCTLDGSDPYPDRVEFVELGR